MAAEASPASERRAAAQNFESARPTTGDEIQHGELPSIGRAVHYRYEQPFGGCDGVVTLFGEIARRGGDCWHAREDSNL